MLAMRKNFIYLAIAAIALAGCAKESQISVTAPQDGKAIRTITASIPETKTSVEINDQKEGIYSWTENEKIAVCVVDGGVEEFKVADLTNGTFQSVNAIDETAALSFAVSPASALDEYSMADATDVMFTIKLSGTYNIADGTNAVMLAGAPEQGADGNDKFTFRHVAGLMKVTYQNVPVGTYGLRYTTDKPIVGNFNFESLDGVELTQPETGGKTAKVLISAGVTSPNTTVEFYVPVPTGNYGSFEVALFDENEDDIEGTVRSMTANFTVNKADIVRIPTIKLEATPFYRKVTSTADLKEGGSYLIVYEGDETHAAVAFNGGLNTLDATSNGVAVEINDDNTISKSANVDAAVFTISIENGTILSNSGSYVGVTSNSNGLNTSDNAFAYNNAITIDDNGNAVIAADFDGSIMSLRYNYATNQLRFRYYKDNGQQPIALYLLDGTGSDIVIKQDPQLSYSSTTYSITMGEKFTAPILANPNEVSPITYSSSDTEVATVDASTGVVTIEGTGSATITASFAGSDTYKAGSAYYTITVTPAPGHGTSPEDPYTVAEARAAIDANAGITGVYVVGIVSEIVTEYSSQFHNISFNISSDGSTGSDQIEAYRCKNLNNTNFTSEDDVLVGDEVVVYGNLKLYQDTYEFDAGCYLVSRKTAPYFHPALASDTIAYDGGEITLNIDSNTSWTVAIAGSTGAATASLSATSGSNAGSITITIPENQNGATYTLSFTATGVSPNPSNLEIVQEKYVNLVEAVATFTSRKSGGMAAASDEGASGTRRNVTASISKGGNNSGSGYIQVYKNATLTLSVPEGAYITDIDFTGTSENPVSGFGTITGLTTSGNNGSWAGNATSVTFTASAKQVRLTGIDVTYKIAAEELVDYTPVINVTSDNPMSVANTAGTKTITYEIDDAPDGAVLTNVTKSNGATWISNIVYTTSGTVTFDVAAQEEDAEARTATLTLSYTGATDVPVTVNQAEGPSSSSGSYTMVPTQTIQFSSLYSSNTTLDETAISGTNCSLVFNKRSGGTATQYYTNGTSVRWYGGGTLVVTAPDGYKITSIKIHYTQTANSVSADKGSYSLSNGVGTWSGEIVGGSVTFTQSGTSGHCRISSIEIN